MGIFFNRDAEEESCIDAEAFAKRDYPLDRVFKMLFKMMEETGKNPPKLYLDSKFFDEVMEQAAGFMRIKNHGFQKAPLIVCGPMGEVEIHEEISREAKCRCCRPEV